MPFNIITILSLLVVGIAAFKFWYLSDGNLWLTYRLDLVVYTAYTILETYLALRDPSQTSLLLMNIINIWALMMAVKGIMRLKKEEKKKLAEG